MNNLMSQLLVCIQKNPKAKQREISGYLGVSLGKVNKMLQQLQLEQYLDDEYCLTDKGTTYISDYKPNKAVILAAGMGFRMIPLNKTTNKALLIAHNETLISRLIRQLKEAGIHDITIVIGYKKEEFDFLIDRYNVKVVVNNEYAGSNSLYSLYKVRNKLSNCYIIPCDLYFFENPFFRDELYSWYMQNDSCEYLPLDLKYFKAQNGKWFRNHFGQEVGIAYISSKDTLEFVNVLEALYHNVRYKDAFWEEVIFNIKKPIFHPLIIPIDSYIECNCVEDLVHIDEYSPSLDTKIFDIIIQVFHIQRNEIKNIQCTKAGMTNNSFLFEIHNQKYIMRIPGDGTELLINRTQEYEVYSKIGDLHLSDKLYYFDKYSGCKITKYIDHAHNCDPHNKEEVTAAMEVLKKFHQQKLVVGHSFDLFERIKYYELLWNGTDSIYADYHKTKSDVFQLREIIEKIPKEHILTHIDAVPDNFIFHKENDEMKINLIDWEYAAMHDPHLDIAMFAIYALYERDQVDALIDIYFKGECPKNIRYKIYCYIACAGLLWSNWCEYKRQLGIEFGEYSLRQYRYAKDYCRIVKQEFMNV